MRDFTKYVTLKAAHSVQAEEIRLAVEHFASGPRPSISSIERSFILGSGANHAFGSSTGRFRFVETLATEESEEGEAAPVPESFATLARECEPGMWEWLNLVGIDDSYDIEGIDYRPGHRIGTEFADHKNQVNPFVKFVNSDSSFMYRLLIQRELAAMRDLVVEEFGTETAFRKYFTGPPRGIAFVNHVPTANTKVELEYQSLANPNYRYKQHDRGDILAASLALPYCDAIWLDKHWTHTARSARLSQEYGTRMIESASDLLDLLESPDLSLGQPHRQACP